MTRELWMVPALLLALTPAARADLSPDPIMSGGVLVVGLAVVAGVVFAVQKMRGGSAGGADEA